MAQALQQLGCFLKKLLEQTAVRTEDGRLIYQDQLCMSWAAICDAHPSGQQRDSIQSNDRNDL